MNEHPIESTSGRISTILSNIKRKKKKKERREEEREVEKVKRGTEESVADEFREFQEKARSLGSLSSVLKVVDVSRRGKESKTARLKSVGWPRLWFYNRNGIETRFVAFRLLVGFGTTPWVKGGG